MWLVVEQMLALNACKATSGIHKLQFVNNVVLDVNNALLVINVLDVFQGFSLINFIIYLVISSNLMFVYNAYQIA